MAEELIEVFKDGETIYVHPLTLENHLKLGWKQVGKVEVVEGTEEKPAGKKPAGKKPAGE